MRPQVEIRVRRVVGGESAVLDSIAVLGDFGDVFTAQEVRVGRRLYVRGADLFGVGVVNGFIGQINTDVAVDAHVSVGGHFVRGRVIARVIGIDVAVADMDLDVVVRCRDPVFVAGFPGRGDFDRCVLRRFDRALGKTAGQ